MFDLIQLLFTEVIYRPIYNLVVIIYKLTPGPNFGWAMIGLAVLIRFLFIVFTVRGLKTDEVLKELEPEIKKVEADQTLSSAEKRSKVITLMKANKINPYTEIYTLLGQIGFLSVNYIIIQNGLKPEGFHNLYSWVSAPESINTVFFGIDLIHTSFVLSLIAAGFLFIEQVWEYNDKKDLPVGFSERWFPLLLAILTFILLYILPSAKAVFIATSVVFSLCIRAIVKLARPTG